MKSFLLGTWTGEPALRFRGYLDRSCSRFFAERRGSYPLSRGSWSVLGLLLFLAALPARAEPETRPLLLTRVAQVHDLPPSLVSSARLHLTGTITYYDPPTRMMFLQDRTGAVFINTDKDYPVRAGDLVEVEGRPTGSYNIDVKMDPTIRVLGAGARFATRLYAYHELVAGVADCHLVMVRGRVRAADVGPHTHAPMMHLDLAMPGGEAEIYVSTFDSSPPESLLDAEVEVTGVAGGSFDAKWQLTGAIVYVQSVSQIRVIRKPLVKAYQLPSSDIDNVFQSLDVQDRSRRVRVHGTLTYYKKGYSAVLQQGSKSIYIQTRQSTGLSVGDQADAFGFASDSGYAPSLRDAILVKTGGHTPVTPRKVSYTEALSGAYSDDLVSITGILVSELHDVGSDTLVLNVDGHLVNAYLEGTAPIEPFLAGSRIRIVGICRVLPGNPWQAPYVFHLEMRTGSDARLMGNPSWWTIEHLVELLSALSVLALLIALWAIILRGRVLKQTRRISRSMAVAHERSKILGNISANQSTPDVLLCEICESVKLLLPGTACSYFLSPGTEPAESDNPDRTSKLFEVLLTGPDEEVLGKLAASMRTSQFLFTDRLSADQEEIYAMVSELAPLAIRQSLLYERLVHHSTHDPLTELPNRRLCEFRLTEALQEAEQQGGRLLVIYIDVDHFKQVNDQYGHKVGDMYLRQISGRLLTQIRPVDTLARIGGDEFLVIASIDSGFDSYHAFTARLRACFDDCFCIEGATIQGSASFGIASYPEHGTTAEDLKRNADQAMYLAKQSEARKIDATIEIAVITPHELELALRKDLFRLAYQPQFSFEGRLTGMEALLRLEDPILGTLTPDAFISVAERYEVIREIGLWVLRQAVKDATRWKLHEGEEVVLAVNVSVSQMRDPDFAESVLACLKENSFPAQRLEFELIERSLMSSSNEVTRQLEFLRQAGVRISLDDFGTGQSCLSMLHKLPIDTIKLDRAFILAMDHEPTVLPIIRAITAMAHSLGKRVVAEGLEHEGPVATLLSMGEMDFQGYLLSRPLSAREIEDSIGNWRRGIEMPQAFRQVKTSYGKRES